MPIQKISFPPIPADQTYREPQKCINTEEDVQYFKSTVAYARITAFIYLISDHLTDTPTTVSIPLSGTMQSLLDICRELESYVDQIQPVSGPRRFGNASFKSWHARMELNTATLLSKLNIPQSALVEVVSYFQGSFGSKQRLDYGTGHELSFMVFICCLYQLKLISLESPDDNKAIALKVFPAYLRVIRRCVVEYTLEPAGSHGVWGLDDHFFLPYLFGASQLRHLSPQDYPTPNSITNARTVSELKDRNLYFDAINFINEVKKGPFSEHSPILYDISGVPNWGKISTGMVKMFNAEVLGKFPVVQHLPFGPTFFPFIPQSQQDTNRETQSTHLKDTRKAQRQDNDEEGDEAVSELAEIKARTRDLHTNDLPNPRNSLTLDTPLPIELSLSPRPILHQHIHSHIQTHASPHPSSSPVSSPIPNQAGMVPTARRPIPPDQRLESFATRTSLSSPTPSTFRSETATNVSQESGFGTAHGIGAEGAETVNRVGMSMGIGFGGTEGTKAPFAGARSIHPKVLESLRSNPGRRPPIP